MPSKKLSLTTTEPPVKRSTRAASAEKPDTKKLEKEVTDLLSEGLLVRYAGVLRRLQLQGPVNFIDPPPKVDPVRIVKELSPRYLKKVPEGWVVTGQGYEKEIVSAHALLMGRLINAQKDDLGVFRFEKSGQGGKVIFDF